MIHRKLAAKLVYQQDDHHLVSISVLPENAGSRSLLSVNTTGLSVMAATLRQSPFIATFFEAILCVGTLAE